MRISREPISPFLILARLSLMIWKYFSLCFFLLIFFDLLVVTAILLLLEPPSYLLLSVFKMRSDYKSRPTPRWDKTRGRFMFISKGRQEWNFGLREGDLRSEKGQGALNCMGGLSGRRRQTKTTKDINSKTIIAIQVVRRSMITVNGGPLQGTFPVENCPHDSSSSSFSK